MNILVSRDQKSYAIKKCEEGYVITHNWQEVINHTPENYPVYDYKSEEFAYTLLVDAIEKLQELLK